MISHNLLFIFLVCTGVCDELDMLVIYISVSISFTCDLNPFCMLSLKLFAHEVFLAAG